MGRCLITEGVLKHWTASRVLHGQLRQAELAAPEPYPLISNQETHCEETVRNVRFTDRFWSSRMHQASTSDLRLGNHLVLPRARYAP